MVLKKFLYFIGDTFSRELLDLIRNIEQIDFVPIHPGEHSDFNHIVGIIYTPSINFKEKELLKLLPQRVRKIAILDLFHFDFKDYLLSFNTYPPDLVFTPRKLEHFVKNTVIIPSFIQHIYSPLLNQINPNPNTNFKDICFISQPLLEERSLAFNQHNLILKLQALLDELSPLTKIFVKPHPREDLNLHKNYKLFQDPPKEVLSSFYYFAGFNSALLYAAEGLGKSVYKISNPEEITTASIEDFLSKKQSLAHAKPAASPLSILAKKLNSLN